MNEINTYKGIPAMTSDKVHNYLRELGRGWTGKGVVMELGCWLGASSLPLLEGLVQSGYEKIFWAFDRWIANEEQVSKAMNSVGWKLMLNQSLEQLYLANVRQVYTNVKIVKGMLPETLGQYYRHYIVEDKIVPDIEICIFDAPKREPIFTGCVKALLDKWIPGVTVLGLLDYKFYERHQGKKKQWFRAPVDFIEKYSDNFELIKQWDDECPVFFRYVKRIKGL